MTRAAWLVVCGHANVDTILHVQRIPAPGTSEPVASRTMVHGGTGANVARHAAGLGVPVRLWARVGQDFPDAWRAALERDGVELRLDVDAALPTPACTVLSGPEQAYCMDQGAMRDMARHPPTEDLLDGASWLHLATGDPRAYHGLAQAARRRGVAIAIDPGQELRTFYDARTFERLLGLADVAFLNRHETDVALRMLSYGDPVQLLDHVPALVVTRGADGASLYRVGQRPLHVPAPPATVRDATGAGDALRAGWHAAIHAGKTMDDALAWGQRAAAAVLGMQGPQERAIRQADVRAP